MNLALLKKEARETGARMEARLNKAIEENRDLTAEEQAEQAADQAALDRQLAHIKQAESLSASIAGLGVEAPAPTGASASPAAASSAQPRNPAPSSDGFGSLGEFAQAVRFANPMAGGDFRMDPRLSAPANVHTEQGDAAGSYLVPAEYREEIVDLVFGDSDAIMSLIAPEPTSKNKVQGLGDETTPWGTNGVQAYWRGESDQMTASKLVLTPRETAVDECYAFVNASEELLEDAPRLANYLQKKAPAAIRWKAVDAFMWGDGVGKPLGWMTSAARVTISKESGQAADTIVPANISKAYARMLNPELAVWLANSDTLPQLMALTSPAGQPLWHPNYSVAPGGMLLGRPVYWTEHADTIGDAGDLQFVNPKGYEAFRKQNGVSFAESIHLFFDYNVRAFRWIFRIGGQPVLSAPVSGARSAATKSHFVAIEAR